MEFCHSTLCSNSIRYTPRVAIAVVFPDTIVAYYCRKSLYMYVSLASRINAKFLLSRGKDLLNIEQKLRLRRYFKLLEIYLAAKCGGHVLQFHVRRCVHSVIPR